MSLIPYGEGDVNDPPVEVPVIGQHGLGAVEAAFHDMIGERFSSLLQQALDIAARQAEVAGDAVELEIRVAEALRDHREDRAQTRGFQPTLPNDLSGLGGRSERCRSEIDEMRTDYVRQVGGRCLFEGRERSQVL